MTHRRATLHFAALLVALAVSACVYRPNILQGNYIDEDKLEQVQPGMTRGQVEFLLGTPVVQDTFHEDRWDYVFFFKPGDRKYGRERLSRFVVYFDGDVVERVETHLDT